MRGQSAEDEKQRVVHALVREAGNAADLYGALEHLSVEDFAALASGTLFKTECARIENHLAACADCRGLARDVHDEFEAGVVPILMRRAANPKNTQTRLSVRLTRRWWPWWLSLLAALLVMRIADPSFLDLTNTADVVESRGFVVKRLGTPFFLPQGASEPLPVDPGTWLAVGDALETEAGDYLLILNEAGALQRVAGGQWTEEQSADDFARQIFSQAWADRAQMEADLLAPALAAQRAGNQPRFIHPLDDLADLRPCFRWYSPSVHETYEVQVFDEQKGGLIFSHRTNGRHFAFPSEVLSLSPGRRFRLELRSSPFNGPAVANAFFATLDEHRITQIDKELRLLAPFMAKGPQILRAEYFRQRGLHAQAREELARLRVQETENLLILERLKVVYRALNLPQEERQTAKLIKKRR